MNRLNANQPVAPVSGGRRPDTLGTKGVSSARYTHRLALALVSFGILFGTTAPTQAAASVGSWGINVQTLYHGAALQNIGTQWVRLSLGWQDIEKAKKGQYDWTAADKALSYYAKANFHILCVLTAEHINPLYEKEQSNKSVVTSAVAKWMGATAQHFKDVPIIWEIGNEPEVFPMNDYWNNPATYSTMARAAAKAIKQAAPAAKVAVLATGWMDKGYATAAFKAGLLADGTIDYVSFHGYHRQSITPESGLADDVAWLRAASAAAAPSNKSPIVIDSETGYTIVPIEAPKGKNSWRLAVYSEETQAAFLARHFIEEINIGLPISIWYKDMNGENAYSLYYADERDPRGLRPSGKTFRTLATLLPENPSDLKNDNFPVTVTPRGNHTWATPPQLWARSFLHTNADNRPELIIAVWNAVEASDGKILDTRTFTATQCIERWRSATASDPVTVPAEVNIDQLTAKLIQSIKTIALPDGQVTKLASSSSHSTANGFAIDISAQSMPTILQVVLTSQPRSPTQLRLTN